MILNGDLPRIRQLFVLWFTCRQIQLVLHYLTVQDDAQFPLLHCHHHTIPFTGRLRAISQRPGSLDYSSKIMLTKLLLAEAIKNLNLEPVNSRVSLIVNPKIET